MSLEMVAFGLLIAPLFSLLAVAEVRKRLGFLF